MAVLFDDASSEYLEYAGAVVTGVPLTMAAWVKSDETPPSSGQIAVAIDRSGSTHGYRIGWVPAFIRYYASASETPDKEGRAISPFGETWGVWRHLCGVFAAADSRAVYVDGGNKGIDVANVTPSSLDLTGIGRASWAPSRLAFWSGVVAWPCIWNVALTDEEVAELATGAWPPLIRPESLVAFWPLYSVNDMRDIKGGYNLTAYNTPTTADNPRIFMPHRRTFYSVPATLGGVGSIFDSGIFRPALVR